MDTTTALTVRDVITRPLPDLLAHPQVNGSVEELDGVDEAEGRFFGALRDLGGRIVLLMPKGQDPVERDCATRGLIATWLGLDTSAWPKFMCFDDARDEERAA